MASEASMYVDSEEAMPLPERFQQLRHSLHGHWGTTAEADLLRAMQQLHTRLVARSAQTHRRVEELSQRVTAAQVSLANALNALKLLSQHQFVQHRIATEDLQQRQRAVAGSSSEEADGGSSDGTVSPNRALTTSLPTHTTKEAAVRRRMHDYVEMCKESLAEEGVRVPLCPGDVAELAAESPYAHRRLCGLIGTTAFLYDADIGCRRGADMMNAAAVKQRQSPQPQPACLPAAAPPAVVTGVLSASAKPLFPPSAAAKASVPPPHATATGAVAPPAKAPRAQSSVVPPPTAAKSAPAKKERQQALSNSVSSACAEAAKRAAYSPTSSDLSSSDDSRPPPAAARKANNPSPPPLAATTTSPPLPQSATPPSRTAAGPQPPRRGGKVLSTSSDDDAE
ncbi:hypothetical protein CGC21_18585 [Leishmania donovani]|uniref:Uncharacterized protein n=1 Tax=Leishmania donovani TaxID=5661 RepID=A0A504Y1M8_LEIDO|nr:hypothetical protein CGC21_18585 [Leishmania donovani]